MRSSDQLSSACGESVPVQRHANGGGTVALTASVGDSVFVDAASSICEDARISGDARVINGTIIRGSIDIMGQAVISGSNVSGTVFIYASQIRNSNISGNAEISDSDITSSNISGNAIINNETLTSVSRTK